MMSPTSGPAFWTARRGHPSPISPSSLPGALSIQGRLALSPIASMSTITNLVLLPTQECRALGGTVLARSPTREVSLAGVSGREHRRLFRRHGGVHRRGRVGQLRRRPRERRTAVCFSSPRHQTGRIWMEVSFWTPKDPATWLGIQG